MDDGVFNHGAKLRRHVNKKNRGSIYSILSSWLMADALFSSLFLVVNDVDVDNEAQFQYRFFYRGSTSVHYMS